MAVQTSIGNKTSSRARLAPENAETQVIVALDRQNWVLTIQSACATCSRPQQGLKQALSRVSLSCVPAADLNEVLQV